MNNIKDEIYNHMCRTAMDEVWSVVPVPVGGNVRLQVGRRIGDHVRVPVRAEILRIPVTNWSSGW